MDNKEIREKIFEMMNKNMIFIKCPKCKNYLCLFEAYNSHCNKCGDVDQTQLIILSLE